MLDIAGIDGALEDLVDALDMHFAVAALRVGGLAFEKPLHLRDRAEAAGGIAFQRFGDDRGIGLVAHHLAGYAGVGCCQPGNDLAVAGVQHEEEAHDLAVAGVQFQVIGTPAHVERSATTTPSCVLPERRAVCRSSVRP